MKGPTAVEKHQPYGYEFPTSLFQAFLHVRYILAGRGAVISAFIQVLGRRWRHFIRHPVDISSGGLRPIERRPLNLGKIGEAKGNLGRAASRWSYYLKPTAGSSPDEEDKGLEARGACPISFNPRQRVRSTNFDRGGSSYLASPTARLLARLTARGDAPHYRSLSSPLMFVTSQFQGGKY